MTKHGVRQELSNVNVSSQTTDHRTSIERTETRADLRPSENIGSTKVPELLNSRRGLVITF